MEAPKKTKAPAKKTTEKKREGTSTNKPISTAAKKPVAKSKSKPKQVKLQTADALVSPVESSDVETRTSSVQTSAEKPNEKPNTGKPSTEKLDASKPSDLTDSKSSDKDDEDVEADVTPAMEDDDKTDNSNNNKDNSNAKTSKYYFFKSTPKEEAVKYQPQKIDKPAEAKLTNSATVSGVSSQSAWNKDAGTWEDTDMTTWVHERVKTLFLSAGPSLCDTTQLTVIDTTVSGEASILFTRGKKRIGFELNISVKFTADDGIEGTIDMPSVDETSVDDFGIEVKCDHEETRRGIESSFSTIRELFDGFVAEFRKQ